jgi:DNA repair exonuclease SbcCD ATPase subunit
MSSEYDATEFVDNDFQAAHKAAYTGGAGAPGMSRAPSREEVDSKVGETQQKLAELKRIQEELERERAGLEETRRRQIEFQTGRQEAIQSLTRGVGLLSEAEFAARRDAEQMARALLDMRDALAKVEATNEQAWTKESFAVELTRALTVIENARMEWNAARLKFPILSVNAQTDEVKAAETGSSTQSWLAGRSFGQLCKLGLALTWPLAIVALVALGLLVTVVLQHWNWH